MTGDPLLDDGTAITNAVNSIANINTLLPGGFHEGPLTDPATFPYASYSIKQGPHANEYNSPGSGGGVGDWINYSEIVITIYGVGAQPIAVLAGQIGTALETMTITVANADVMRLERLPGETNDPEPQEKAGTQVRKASLHYCLWTHRRG